jgi:hypothetical protein
VAAAGADALIERPQRPGAAHGGVRSFDEDVAHERGAVLGDPAGAGRRVARLAGLGVKAEVAEQPTGGREARDVAGVGEKHKWR